MGGPRVCRGGEGSIDARNFNRRRELNRISLSILSSPLQRALVDSDAQAQAHAMAQAQALQNQHQQQPLLSYPIAKHAAEPVSPPQPAKSLAPATPAPPPRDVRPTPRSPGSTGSDSDGGGSVDSTRATLPAATAIAADYATAVGAPSPATGGTLAGNASRAAALASAPAPRPSGKFKRWVPRA